MAKRCLLFAPFWLLIDLNNIASLFGKTTITTVTIRPISSPARARRFPKRSVVVLQFWIGVQLRWKGTSDRNK